MASKGSVLRADIPGPLLPPVGIDSSLCWFLPAGRRIRCKELAFQEVLLLRPVTGLTHPIACSYISPFPYACSVSELTDRLQMRVFKTAGLLPYCLCFSSKFLSSLSFLLSRLTLVTSQKS